MNKTLVVFSTFLEAQATLKTLHLPENTPFIKTGFGAILISGMGMLNTYQSLTEHGGKKYSELLLVGVAGALKNSYAIGDLMVVNGVFRYLPPSLWKLPYQKYFHQSLYPPFFVSAEMQKQSKRILCSDYPIHDKKEKLALGQHFDLVDMESYAFALYATTHKLPYHIYKIVSDTPSQSGEKGEIVQRINTKLSKKLYPCLIEFLEKKQPPASL